jgi:hypothetical protein
MNMTPRNIILLIVAIVVGLFIGLAYPLIGLLLLIPVLVWVVVILLRNNSGSDADPGLAAAARQFTAPAGKAGIYVMRDGFVAGQQGFNLTIDGSHSTQFRTGRFAHLEVDPGEHSVTGQMASQSAGTALSQTVTLVAGECVLLDVKLNMGMLQGSLEFLETRDPAVARGKLARLKLVEWKA